MVLIFLICSHILLNKFIRTSIMTLWPSIIILHPYISIYGRKYPASLALCAFLSNNKTGSLYFEINLTSPYCGFSKYVIISSYIFPKNLIEVPRVVQKIWRFSSSILTIFINFSDFLTFPSYIETSGVST